MATVMYSGRAERLVEKNLYRFKIPPDNLERCARHARSFVSFLLNTPLPEVKVEYRHPKEIEPHYRHAVGKAFNDRIIINAGLMFEHSPRDYSPVSPLVELSSYLSHEYTHVSDRIGLLGRRKAFYISRYNSIIEDAERKPRYLGLFGTRLELPEHKLEILKIYSDIIDGCSDMAEARAARVELACIKHALKSMREFHWDRVAEEYYRRANPGYYNLLRAYMALERKVGFELAWNITTYNWFKDRFEAWNGDAFAERVLNTIRISNIQLEPVFKEYPLPR